MDVEFEEIYVLNKRVKLRQLVGGFWTSLDSIMLAAACPAKNGDHILDLGCSVGGVGFCILERIPRTQITGIDIQPEAIELANQNITLNNMEGRAHFLTGNIRTYKNETRFDHVVCNPPYMEAGTHLRSPSEKRAQALGHEEEDTHLQDWLDAAHRNLKPRGSLTIIHRADATHRIIQGLGKRFGAIEIIPLHPRVGEPAKRVIIRALKDRQTASTIHPGIILHNSKNGGEKYTVETEGILRRKFGVYLS